jgi:pirin-like protein
MLFGGMPLGEPLLMWWNFVARTPDEIASAADGWARWHVRSRERVRRQAARPTTDSASDN